MPTKEEYAEMSVKELEQKAKDAGISGYSSMKKDELVRALDKQLPKDSSARQSGKEASSRQSSSMGGQFPGVLALIKKDHDEVKELFESFEQEAESDLEGSAEIAKKIISELIQHTELEEQIVYPGLKKQDADTYYEATEEHHVADLLMEEIKRMRPDDVYKAKMVVLAENVRHHIKEEETEAFPLLKKLGNDRLEEMGRQWEQAKASRSASR
jgi:hemerythrin-like domain-containing protein